MITPITSEAEWLRVLSDSPRWAPPRRRTVVLSPHPDDETLGAGGLIAAQRRRGIDVAVVAATDGEAAYQEFPGLGRIRQAEQESALRALGVPIGKIVRLRLPDSRIADYEDRLFESLMRHILPGDLLVAPWVLDFHPDHEVCGRVAGRVARCCDCTVIYHLFWAWHRAQAEAVASLPLRRFELDGEIQSARAAALDCHRSQLQCDQEPPILPDLLLGPARRSFETYIIHA